MVQGRRIPVLRVSVIIFATIATVFSASSPVKKRSLFELTEGIDNTGLKLEPIKKTICNAFTGCPGKRDEVVLLTPEYDYDPQGLMESGDATDDDPGRDILAEARLYEALQARNAMRLVGENRFQGFFPRQKRGIKNYKGLRHNVGKNILPGRGLKKMSRKPKYKVTG